MAIIYHPNLVTNGLSLMVITNWILLLVLPMFFEFLQSWKNSSSQTHATRSYCPVAKKPNFPAMFEDSGECDFLKFQERCNRTHKFLEWQIVIFFWGNNLSTYLFVYLASWLSIYLNLI